MGWYKEARLRRQPAGSHEPASCLSPRAFGILQPKEMRIAPLRFNPWSHVEDLLCPLGAWLPGHRCVPSWQTKHKIRMGPWCCSREASSEQALAPSGLRNSPLLLLTPKLLSEICFVCDCSLHTMRCPSMGLGKATVWSFGLSVVARARSLS
jgi:hypothetical protein